MCFQLLDNDNKNLEGSRSATGYLIGQKEGEAFTVSARNVDQTLADDLCYAMGFTFALGLEAVNNTKGQRGEPCYIFQFPEEVTPDSAHMLLVPSQNCDQVLRLTCQLGCGLTEARETTDSEKSKHTTTDFPWLVEISGHSGTDNSKCQGALVSEDWVLAPSTCAPVLTSDLSVHLNNQVDHPQIDITTMIKFHLTAKDSNLTDVTNYNAVLLRMNTPIKTPAVHPVCIEEDSLVSYPVCVVSTTEKGKDIKKAYRLSIRDREICDENGVALGVDEQCMEFLHPQDENLCLNTDKAIVQCYEKLSKRFRLAGIVRGDVGACGGKDTQDLVAVADLTPESLWIFNAGGFNLSREYKCGTLDADRANRYDEYYMTLRSSASVQTLLFADNTTLDILTRELVNVTGSNGAVLTGDKSNVTSSDIIKVTCKQEHQTICDCDKETVSGIRTVPTFILTVPDNDNRFGPELEFEQDLETDFDDMQDDPDFADFEEEDLPENLEAGEFPGAPEGEEAESEGPAGEDPNQQQQPPNKQDREESTDV